MTAEEKAIELVSKFDGDLITDGWGETAFIDSKKCALIAVDEFIEYLRWTQDYHLANYWREVKQEIENG